MPGGGGTPSGNLEQPPRVCNPPSLLIADTSLLSMGALIGVVQAMLKFGPGICDNDAVCGGKVPKGAGMGLPGK